VADLSVLSLSDLRNDIYLRGNCIVFHLLKTLDIVHNQVMLQLIGHKVRKNSATENSVT
jgi:hypothetical protein